MDEMKSNYGVFAVTLSYLNISEQYSYQPNIHVDILTKYQSWYLVEMWSGKFDIRMLISGSNFNVDGTLNIHVDLMSIRQSI